MITEDPDAVLRDRMIFYPVAILATIFCISIFAVIAATFGDQQHPVNKWVNANANGILIGETILLVVTAIGTMTIDRVRTLRKLAREGEAGKASELPVFQSKVPDNVD